MLYDIALFIFASAVVVLLTTHILCTACFLNCVIDWVLGGDHD